MNASSAKCSIPSLANLTLAHTSVSFCVMPSFAKLTMENSSVSVDASPKATGAPCGGDDDRDDRVSNLVDVVMRTIPEYIRRHIIYPDSSYAVTLKCSTTDINGNPSLIHSPNTLEVVYKHTRTIRARTAGTVTFKASLKDEHGAQLTIPSPTDPQKNIGMLQTKPHLTCLFGTILEDWRVENLYYDDILALAPVVDATLVHAAASIVDPDADDQSLDVHTVVAKGKQSVGPVVLYGDVGRVDPSQSSTLKEWKPISQLETAIQQND